jgi:acyl carrier protein
VARFVHVSSLAAREPQLSLYGASKARSEALVEAPRRLDWAIVRPPAVYGPGDRRPDRAVQQEGRRGHRKATRFAQDLEWDSLTVLDFVANVEDEFDILITMNQQAEIETVGQLVDAVEPASTSGDHQ